MSLSNVKFKSQADEGLKVPKTMSERQRAFSGERSVRAAHKGILNFFLKTCEILRMATQEVELTQTQG